jgi:hypothetical protein
MRYEKIAVSIRNVTPDKRLIKLDLRDEDVFKLKSAAGVALAIIGIASLATVALVAPNLLQALHKFSKLSGSNRRFSYKKKQQKVADMFYYLKRTGKIRIMRQDKELMLKLTSKGQRLLEKLGFQRLRVKNLNKWDRKWWLVAADIPTKEYRLSADNFRKKIKQMGFYFLQRTLWLYPYNPTKEIEFVANHFNIGRFVTVMEINRLDQDDEKKLKTFFKDTI